MRAFLLALTFVLAAAFATPITAAPDSAAPPVFSSRAEEQRFHDLLAELRCVMCQNQSLADSNAQIAVELRKEVLTLMREGRNDDEVKAFLVQRYGEFILYRPAMNARNIALWASPFVLLFAAFVGLWWWRRSRPGGTSVAADDSDQKDVQW